MKRSTRSSRSKQLTDIQISELTSKSTCINLSIPYELACYNCEPKLCVLTNRRVNKKLKTERQKCRRSQCQQLWDTYWTHLPNVTNGLIQKQNQQRRYLGIKTDVVINNHYKDIQNADTNDINIGTNYEKNDTTHATSLLNIE